MSNTETYDLIPVHLFDTCKICNTLKKDIIKTHPTRRHGAYYLDKFINFLEENHKIDIKTYCQKYLNIQWPRCPISDERVGFKVGGKGLSLSKFKRGKISKEHCPAFAEGCKKLSLDRMGKNNPMHGLSAWNKGKDKRNPIVKKMAESMKNRKVSLETRQRQSESAKKRQIHGHTGIRHSPKTRKKMREHTAKLWASGVFNRTMSIHLKMREFLNTLSLKEKFLEEHQVKYFSLDFAFPLAKVGIECQGMYFHIDPRIYPNGPIDAIQRRNFERDKQKHKFLKNDGWTVIECWETEINDGGFKEFLINKLKELNLI